jgi:hypothetical protein
MVPEDYSDDTIVTCPKCDYRARWADVFGKMTQPTCRLRHIVPKLECRVRASTRLDCRLETNRRGIRNSYIFVNYYILSCDTHGIWLHRW